MMFEQYFVLAHPYHSDNWFMVGTDGDSNENRIMRFLERNPSVENDFILVRIKGEQPRFFSGLKTEFIETNLKEI